MDLNKITLVTLKEIARNLGLTTTGSKAEVISRLMSADPSGNWMTEILRKDAGEISVEEEDNMAALDAGPSTLTNATTVESLGRELDLMHREKILMERELRLMQRENEMLRASPRLEADVVPVRPKVNIKTVSELLIEFTSSNIPFHVWEQEVTLLCRTYELNDNDAKILVGTRLKGKAYEWYHSRAEFIGMPFAELLKAMKEVYVYRPSKMVLRKEFEDRKWKENETFAEYMHAKTVLANQVSVEQEELIDHAIDGISDNQLRNQARMQWFDSTSSLLAAFSKIRLMETKNRGSKEHTIRDYTKKEMQSGKMEVKFQKKPISGADGGTTSSAAIRCFNCSGYGHYASSCTQRKRDKGSCFKCGQVGHIIKECPQREKLQVNYINQPSANTEEFKKSIILKVNVSDFKFDISMKALIDTGSPISFIKEKFVPKNVMNDCDNNGRRFCGINDSKLVVLGTIIADIVIDDTIRENIVIYVVPDKTMTMPIVLGRDVLKEFNIRLSEPESDAVNEIMNIEVDVSENDAEVIDVNTKMEHATQLQVKNLFVEKYLNAKRPEVPAINTELKLTLSDEKPFQFAPRRLSYFEKTQLREILDELLAAGTIRPSESEFASPIVLVKKKNGKLRMCIDYRALNKVIAKDNFPLPVIEDQLEMLNGKRYFSLFDLKDGFHHINMAKDSCKYTSFIIPMGQFEYLKMPFGLKPAPQKFQRHIHAIFSDLIRSGDVIIYIDDILVATCTLDDHFNVLKRVFDCLVKNKLQLRVEKCKVLYNDIEYLGYCINEDGISPTKTGIEAVTNFPIPQNIRNVQSFIGLCSYFRKFIEGFATIAKPLHDLLKKEVEFKFGEVQLHAFEELKNKLIEAPVLAIYNPQDPTELHCDASAVGFGAILMQRKADMKYHPVMYFSKRTSEYECKYHSFELEALAIIYALKRFRIYLQGINFKIITDCNALKLTLAKKDINPRIARWALELQEYDYVLEHRNSERMRHVDALNRMTNILIVDDNSFEFDLSVAQNRDSEIKQLREKLENSENNAYEMRNGLVYRKRNGNLLFYVPNDMENSVIYRYHNETGHLGVNKVCDTIQINYWFPKMKEKIKLHVNNCLKCISFSPSVGKVEGFLYNIPKGSVPFSMLHIDHYGPVDKKHKIKQYVFLIVDAFTKFVKLYATKSVCSKEAIDCLKHYFEYYSKPKVIVSDRGTSFTSDEFEMFLKESDIRHVLIATGSPKANGQVERVNRVLTPMLAKLTDDSTNNYWYKILKDVEYALNNSIHKSTGETPSRLLFGVDQRGRNIDKLKEYLDEKDDDLLRNLETIRDKAKAKIEKSQEYNKSHVDKRRREPHEYECGDYVMVKNFENTVGISKKLLPKYKGPYRVIRKLRNNRYVIADIEGYQITQRPYSGVWEAANLKPWLTIVTKTE